MTDPGEYILRTRAQAERFRERYASIVRARLQVYVKWIRSLPLLTWVPYLSQVEEKDQEVVIGLICLCYLDGFVNITFSRDFRMIRRDPDSYEDFRGYKVTNISKEKAV